MYVKFNLAFVTLSSAGTLAFAYGKPRYLTYILALSAGALVNVSVVPLTEYSV